MCVQIGGVTHIDFAPVYPFNYAVTSSTRVRLAASMQHGRHAIHKIGRHILLDAFRRSYSCAMQVLLYNGRTQQLERQVTRFKDIAYSGCYRVDGRLLTAGGENGIVQVHYDRHDDVGLVLYFGRHWVQCCHVHSHNALVLVREHCVDAQVFDVGSRAVLRQLKGHQRPVHVARFSPDKLHVLSGGDDATV